MPYPVRVLLVDDDLELRDLTSFVLRDAGFEVLSADNAVQALRTWQKEAVDLILLDVVLPGIDGFKTLRTIRQVSDIPVILLTARDQEQDVVAGFEAGADDFVSKPYRSRELVARIQSLLQRSGQLFKTREQLLIFEDLLLDENARRVICGGQNIPVTPAEFRLLWFFMQQPGTVVTKEKLLQQVWGFAGPASDFNLVEAAIKRLRKKIEPNPGLPHYIQTARGVGYRLGN